jgi:2-hydroxychromene-2-carboxylate isomerase
LPAASPAAATPCSPAETLRGIKNKPEYERLETERFIRRHRITQFRRNPFFPVNTEQLVARGPFGAPTFFVGEEIFFGKDRLRDVEEAILASPQ